MDPASFVIGVFGVVCELYKVSLATYDLYCSIQDFTPAFGKLRLVLNIERERLKLWAEYMGIDQDSGINERLQNDPSLLEVIREILIRMKETFDDSAKMLEDYQGAQSPPPASESDQKPDLPRRVSPGTRKTLENYSRIVKWATRDKKRLENLIQTLTKYNNDLDRLATTVEQASMRRRWRTQFMAPRQLEDLRTLQEAATLTGHDDLYREASSKAFVQEVYESEDVCAKLQSTQLQAITEPVTDVSESLDSWKLEF